MPRRLSFLPTLLFLLAAVPAGASHVVVPDDLPTIQEAIDGFADTVFVKDGLKPERLTVTKNVVLLPILNCTAGPPACYPLFSSYPPIQSLVVMNPQSSIGHACCRVRGFRFLGSVSVQQDTGPNTFEACRFDSTASIRPGSPDAPPASIRGCVFQGHLDVYAIYPQVVGNVFLAGMSLWADGVHDIRDNIVLGPADVGMDLDLQESYGPIDGNTIRNCGVGIRVVSGSAGLTNNLVEDCTGDGILIAMRSNVGAYEVVDWNTIRRCGGAGVVFSPQASGDFKSEIFGECKHNWIEHTGADGVRYNEGAWAYPGADSNTILFAGGNGIQLASIGFVIGNTVGHCTGDGILHNGSRWEFDLEGNTSFSNGGAGMRFESSMIWQAPIQRNIAAFNGGPGLSLVEGRVLLSACNDWFQNQGGNVVGVPPGPNGLSVDPMFCNAAGGDAHLTVGSPLIDAPGCGQIGALGVGCGQNAAVQPIRTLPEVRFEARPVPARGVVQFAIPPAAQARRVEIYDVTGARRWEGSVPANSSHLEWDGRDSNSRPAAPGVYYGRLTGGAGPTPVTKIVFEK